MRVSSHIEAGTCLRSDRKTREEQEGEGMRLIECLRGRLFAERQASRAAKEEAELMGKRLVELERKLRGETRLRDKARRKLKFLEKKLECFKGSTLMGGPGRSIESCDGSCRSSSTASLEAKQEKELNLVHISLPCAAEEDRFCESGEKQSQLKSDLPSDVTSPSLGSRAVAVYVYPVARERKEPKKANSNGGGASQNDRKHHIRAQSIGS